MSENDQTASGDGSTTEQQRVERFKEDVAAMGVRDPVAGRDRMLLRLGVALMVAGPVWALVAYFVSHATRNPLQQRDAIIAAVFGLSLAVVGAALFVRYSTAHFLRFWLARNVFEQQRHSDELVEALRGEAPARQREGEPVIDKQPR